MILVESPDVERTVACLRVVNPGVFVEWREDGAAVLRSAGAPALVIAPCSS